ncbi:MAG: hypothetical protein H6664_05715 [Ardenticatenaceae bacterium]|nr:hypothetical protein [Ardenticatenaceae bacterium]
MMTRPFPIELSHLHPTPEEEWERLRQFLSLGQDDITAMLTTVEPLFRRGHELVVGTYDYLLANHDTAVILGWESGVDESHLAERRRFFTVWLARTLGLDFSHDFARYLFRAGQIHAAHGPRRIHVPDVYVTGSISLMHAGFARILNEEMPGHPAIAAALTGWNKVLTLHLHMMLLGYRTAREWDAGDFTVQLAFYGRMRTITHQAAIPLQLETGSDMETVLHKFFNYFPLARQQVFDLAWEAGERLDAHNTPWMTVEKRYQVKKGWRVLRNGRDITYDGGLQQTLSPDDTIAFFPPGR